MQAISVDEAIERSSRDIRSCPWVHDEFRAANFGDRRLFLRFLIVAQHLARLPEAPVNQASQGWPKTKAAYRFFDNDKVGAKDILEPHIAKTAQRIQNQKEPVLVIQDTTFLNYSHMTYSDDLGPIGQLTPGCMGLVMHTSLAVTTQGLPLGIPDQVIWARDKEEHGKATLRRDRDMEDKESYRWLEALRRYHARLSTTSQLITVCDREGDIYDLFYEAEYRLKTKFLIRANHDRSLGSQRLWSSLRECSPVTSYTVEVPARNKHPSRTARVEVRYTVVTLKCPQDRPKHKRLPDIEVSAIYISEIDPPFGSEPVDWMLLLNMPVSSTKEVLEKIDCYMFRWLIEIFHRILKSGCRVEYARFEKNHRRIAYLTLKSIIAWKLLLLVHFHRISPKQPATDLMSRTECLALYAAIHNHLPSTISFNARQGIRWLGQLGGFLARRSDKEPGPTAVWRGWQRLQDFTKMLQIAVPP